MPTKKILSIDDARTVRLMVRKALKAFDVVICEAANGEQGLMAAAAEKPDLILLDVTMPVLDGVGTLTRLKADPQLKKIPVVMLTAEAARDLVVKIVQLGARDYIVKPFTEPVLIEKIRRIIRLDPAANPDQDKKLLVLVEDKLAVVRQVVDGVQDPGWTWQHVASTAEALAIAGQRRVAAVVVSLALPDDGAFKLQREFTARPNGAETSFIGLALKTAGDLRERARQSGFAAVADKPIEPSDLAARVRESLQREASKHAVRLAEENLVVRLADGMSETQCQATLEAIQKLATEAVDSGFRVAVFDLNAVQSPTAELVKLAAQGLAICEPLGLRCVMLGSAALTEALQNFDEAKSWQLQERLEPAAT
jgi:two-component system, cell cycle response regulator